jgi:hypothetical protein
MGRGRALDAARPTDRAATPLKRHGMVFELAINMKAAKAFGLTSPPSVLLWAGHIIE